MATSFEQMVKKLGLRPEEYQSSAQLREWVRRNMDVKYVPPDLLGLRARRSWDRGGSITLSPCMAKEHTHICAECDAAYPCPDPERCLNTAGERTELCPQCEVEQRVEILSRSEDGLRQSSGHDHRNAFACSQCSIVGWLVAAPPNP